MAARGKKNQRTKKGKRAAVKPQAAEPPKEEKEENNDFDLETMEKMLEDNDADSKTNNGHESDSVDKDFMDTDNASDDDKDDNSGTEEESADEQMEDVDTNQSDDSDSGNESEEEEDVNLVEGEENCSLDLRNLLAINSHQVNSRSLYKQKAIDDDDDETTTTISTSGMKIANESYLLQKASEGCSQILAGLWKLETEKTDAGPMAVLPTFFGVVTPRELPPPKPKTETKWEKFAKDRGIAPKEKRSRKVWDEQTGEWGYRTGYQKASSENDPESWPIMEVKRNDDPFDDPWQKARDAKKDRVDKNTMNKMKNAEKGGLLERGTTRRIMKAKKDLREKGREGGQKDIQNFTNQPAGLPKDLVDGNQRGKASTKLALLATQRSTASMGKFDKMREGEPERRKSMEGLKKRKFQSATAVNVVKQEAKKSLKIMENVMSGGGKMKEKAIRRGQFAKGETGHDFEFNDGLGASTYRKKKGRAGIGKMRKIHTKKMAK